MNYLRIKEYSNKADKCNTNNSSKFSLELLISIVVKTYLRTKDVNLIHKNIFNILLNLIIPNQISYFQLFCVDYYIIRRVTSIIIQIEFSYIKWELYLYFFWFSFFVLAPPNAKKTIYKNNNIEYFSNYCYEKNRLIKVLFGNHWNLKDSKMLNM